MTTANRRGQLALALILLLVFGLLATAILAYKLRTFDESPVGVTKEQAQAPTQTDRAKAKATAEQFALRMDGINGSALKKYSESVLAMLTTKGKASFQKQFDSLQQFQFDPKTRGEGKILASALEDIDQDSAVALVAHDNNLTDSRGLTTQHSRWTVSLQKVAGKWLVDDFTPVE